MERRSYDERFAPISERPARPFNAAQWFGVGFLFLALLFYAALLAYSLGRPGFAFARHLPGVVPLMIGVVLVNSRREPIPDPAPELAAARRKSLIVTTLIVVPILLIAAIVSLKGA